MPPVADELDEGASLRACLVHLASFQALPWAWAGRPPGEIATLAVEDFGPLLEVNLVHVRLGRHGEVTRLEGRAPSDAKKRALTTALVALGDREQGVLVLGDKRLHVAQASLGPNAALGSVIFGWARTEPPRASELILAQSAANTLATALASAEHLAQAHRATERARLLTDASAILSSSLDYTSSLGALAQFLVANLTDCCVIEVLSEEPGADPQVAAAHRDPLLIAALRDYRKRELRLLIDTVWSDAVPRFVQFPPQPADQSLHISGLVAAPIVARNKTLGVLVFLSTSGDHVLGIDDVAVAEALGQRVGMAIDNARLYHDVREADRRKDEFLAMLGHELRNPLSPIMSALDLMHLRDDNAHARERAIIERQAKQLTRLVNDLLDVSRVMRGKIELKRERVLLGQIISDAVETVSPLVAERHHQLSTSIAPTIVLEADAARLTQAFTNLLMNSAKYTDPGGKLRIDADVQGDRVLLLFTDNGAGIPRALQKTIFDPFVQGERSIDRRQGGLGIGLTLVRHIVEMLGGRVGVHSEGEGHGSCFTVELPILEGSVSARGTIREEALVNASKRILVVDDNDDARETLADLLRAHGYDVVTAADSLSALHAARAGIPQAALLDLGLPLMDGYELCRRLRALWSGRDVVYAAVTGYGLESDRAKSRDAGFDHHFTKPIDFEALLSLLD